VSRGIKEASDTLNEGMKEASETLSESLNKSIEFVSSPMKQAATQESPDDNTENTEGADKGNEETGGGEEQKSGSTEQRLVVDRRNPKSDTIANDLKKWQVVTCFESSERLHCFCYRLPFLQSRSFFLPLHFRDMCICQACCLICAKPSSELLSILASPQKNCHRASRKHQRPLIKLLVSSLGTFYRSDGLVMHFRFLVCLMFALI